MPLGHSLVSLALVVPLVGLQGCAYIERGKEAVSLGRQSLQVAHDLGALKTEVRKVLGFPAPPKDLKPAVASTSAAIAEESVDARSGEAASNAHLGEALHLALTSVCTNTHRLLVPASTAVQASWREDEREDGDHSDRAFQAAVTKAPNAVVQVNVRLREMIVRVGEQELYLGDHEKWEHQATTGTLELVSSVYLELLDPESELLWSSKEGSGVVELSVEEAKTVYRTIELGQATSGTDKLDLGHVQDILTLAVADAMQAMLPELDARLLELQGQ